MEPHDPAGPDSVVAHLDCPRRPRLHDLRAVLPGRLKPGTVARVSWLPGTQHPTWEGHPHPGYSQYARGARPLLDPDAHLLHCAIVVALAPASGRPPDPDEDPAPYTLVRAATPTEAHGLLRDEQNVTLLHTITTHLHRLLATVAPARPPDATAARLYLRELLGIQVPGPNRHTPDSAAAVTDADADIARVYPQRFPARTAWVIYPEPDQARFWVHDIAEDTPPVHYPYLGILRGLVEHLVQLCPYAPTGQHLDRDRVAQIWPCQVGSVRSLMRQHGVPVAYRDPVDGRGHYRADLVLNARRERLGRGSWRNRSRI